MEHRASPRDDRASCPRAIRPEGSRSPTASVHGIRRRAAASMVRGRGADLGGTAGGGGRRRGRHRRPAAARSNRLARRHPSRRRRVVPGSAGGRGRLPELPRAGSLARRCVAGVPQLVERLLLRAGVRLPHHRTRWNARGESRARSDGGCLVDRVRQHDGRAEGVARRRARSSRRSCSTAPWRGSPAAPARRCSGRCPTDCRPRCCGRSPKVASRCWWRCACFPSSSNGSRSRSGRGSSRTGGGGSSPASPSRSRSGWRSCRAWRSRPRCSSSCRSCSVPHASVGWGSRPRRSPRPSALLFPFVPTDGGRRRRRSRVPHRDHGPRGARPARGRRRAGDVVGRGVPADRRSAGVLARQPRAPRDREPDGGRGDRRPRARVGVVGRLPPRVGGERSHLPRARGGRRGPDRRPGPVVRAVGSRA